METFIPMQDAENGRIRLIKVTPHMIILENMLTGKIPLPKHKNFTDKQMFKMIEDHYKNECINLRAKHRK